MHNGHYLEKYHHCSSFTASYVQVRVQGKQPVMSYPSRNKRVAILRIYIQFSNLYGAVYRQGNVAFTDDGNSVISPVGNRLSRFDLKK